MSNWRGLTVLVCTYCVHVMLLCIYPQCIAYTVHVYPNVLTSHVYRVCGLIFFSAETLSSVHVYRACDVLVIIHVCMGSHFYPVMLTCGVMR